MTWDEAFPDLPPAYYLTQAEMDAALIEVQNRATEEAMRKHLERIIGLAENDARILDHVFRSDPPRPTPSWKHTTQYWVKP